MERQSAGGKLTVRVERKASVSPRRMRECTYVAHNGEAEVTARYANKEQLRAAIEEMLRLLETEE